MFNLDKHHRRRVSIKHEHGTLAVRIEFHRRIAVAQSTSDHRETSPICPDPNLVDLESLRTLGGAIRSGDFNFARPRPRRHNRLN